MVIKKKKKILITGVAGFIGFSLAKKIIESNNYNVIGIDNLNSYYIKKPEALSRPLSHCFICSMNRTLV